MKIACEVVKDMLPLYVDGVVSEESRKIVEEHLSECEECRAYYRSLQGSDMDDVVIKRMDEAASLKQIKRQILKKRIITGIVAVVVVAVVSVSAFYVGFLKEHYVPFGESGLVMNGDVLTATKDYYCYYGTESPDGETQFIYISTTMFLRHHEIDKPLEIMHCGDVSYTEEDGNGNEREVVLKEVYYLPEEYAKSMGLQGKHQRDLEFPENEKAAHEMTEDLKEKSTLIWKRQ